jgi:hypothetical protein
MHDRYTKSRCPLLTSNTQVLRPKPQSLCGTDAPDSTLSSLSMTCCVVRWKVLLHVIENTYQRRDLSGKQGRWRTDTIREERLFNEEEHRR